MVYYMGLVHATYAPAIVANRLASRWNSRPRWWYKAPPIGCLYPGQERSPRVLQSLWYSMSLDRQPPIRHSH